RSGSRPHGTRVRCGHVLEELLDTGLGAEGGDDVATDLDRGAGFGRGKVEPVDGLAELELLVHLTGRDSADEATLVVQDGLRVGAECLADAVGEVTAERGLDAARD